MGIEDVSTTKRDGEQEAIEQINAHTKVDILEKNKLIWIWIAVYLPMHYEDEYWVSSNKKESIPSKNRRNLWHQNFYDDRKWGGLAHYISEISVLVK